MTVLRALGLLILVTIGLKNAMLVVLGAFLTATFIIAFFVMGLYAILQAFFPDEWA